MSESEEKEPDLYQVSTVEIYSVSRARIQIQKKWLFCYIIYGLYASLLWCTVAITIYDLNESKAKETEIEKSSCCKCWEIANEPNYNGPQIDWSYCIQDKCSCNLCNDQYDQYLFIYNNNSNSSSMEDHITCSHLIQIDIASNKSVQYPLSPQRDHGCYSHLSTTSFVFFDKNYKNYGILSIVLCCCHIILLWLYLAICRSVDIGISIFIHSFINGEICYFLMVKSYQFQLNIETNCFQSIMTMNQTKIWNSAIPVILIQFVIQWLYIWTRRCCVKGRIGKKVYQYSGILVLIISILCILYSFILYIWISTVIYKHERIIDEKSSMIPIIIVTVSIFLAVFGIFPFPFCREITGKISQSWKVYLCFRYFRNNKCCKLVSGIKNTPSKQKLLHTYASGLGWEEEARMKLLQQQISDTVETDQETTFHIDSQRYNSLYPM